MRSDLLGNDPAGVTLTRRAWTVPDEQGASYADGIDATRLVIDLPDDAGGPLVDVGGNRRQPDPAGVITGTGGPTTADR